MLYVLYYILLLLLLSIYKITPLHSHSFSFFFFSFFLTILYITTGHRSGQEVCSCLSRLSSVNRDAAARARVRGLINPST